MGNFERTNHMRVMVIPATAATYYPTAVTLGLNADGTLKVDTDTRTTTQGNSYFRDSRLAATVADVRRGFVLRGIFVVTATAGNITVEGHNGTALLLVRSSATVGKVLDYETLGVPMLGGFRIVTSANAALEVLYEVIER